MEKMKEFRTSLKYTVEKMAKEIGVSKSYYEKIETGNREPSRNFIKKFKNRFPQFDSNIFFV